MLPWGIEMKRRKMNAIGFVVMILLLAAEVMGADKQAVTFFVAPDGNDAYPGTEANPFATLERARDAARQAGAHLNRRIVVRGGRYYEVSLTLGPQDSGLSIEALQGEKPALLGGCRVVGWQKDGDRFYAAKLPGVKEGAWDFRCLVVNGEIRPRARVPRTGEFTLLNPFDASWNTTAGGGFRGADKPEMKLRLQYREGDLGSWLDIRNAELTVYHRWDDSVVGLKAQDRETHTLYFSNPAGYPPGAFGVSSYVVWNIREGMHEPGQWYLDRTRGMVVYWPKPGEDIAKIEVVAPSAESIIKIIGNKGTPVSGITLDGLHLCATTTPLLTGGWAAGTFKGAVETSYMRDSSFRHLYISDVGGQAIRMADGMNNTVAQSEITRVGAGGIYDIRGNGNSIVGNRIRGFGLTYASAIGIRTSVDGQKHPEMSHGNEISNNVVSDGPYVGIEFEGWQNRYEHNLVYDVMKVLRDGAAFYGAGKENVIRGNVVRDIPHGKRAHAYYIDELGNGCLVEKNLSVNCEWPVHMNRATNNIIRNNLFISGGVSKLSFSNCSGFVMEKNIIIAEGAISVDNLGGVAAWTDNLFFSRTGQYQGVPEKVQKIDPQFVNADRGNYRFQTKSVAPDLGIEPLDLSALSSY